MAFKIVELSLNVVDTAVDLSRLQAGKAGEISCKTGGSVDCKKRSNNLSCVGTSINMVVDRMQASAEVEDGAIQALRKEIDEIVAKFSKR